MSELVANNGMKMHTIKAKGTALKSNILVKTNDYDKLSDNVKQLMDKNTFIKRVQMDRAKEITQNMMDMLQEKLDRESLAAQVRLGVSFVVG